MSIEVKDLSEHSCLVKLEGSLDFESTRAVKPQFLETADSETIKVMVVDMNDVDFLASEGLAIFLAAILKMEKKDGQVWLINPQPQVMRIFKLTRVENRFRFFDSFEEAKDYLP